MTGYEQELRKLFENSGLIDRPQFSGRVCVGELGKDLRVRAELFSAHVADDYDAIRLTVLNRTEGVVDKTLVRFEDVWGKRIVPGNPNFRSGVIPHLRSDYGELDWYATIQMPRIMTYSGRLLGNTCPHSGNVYRNGVWLAPNWYISVRRCRAM